MLLTIFMKLSILEILKGFEYTSDACVLEKNEQSLWSEILHCYILW